MNPIIKWAGGKRRIVATLIDNAPVTFNTYIEPMVGSGALFLALEPRPFIISDTNPRLISMYNSIKYFAGNVITELNMMVECYLACETEEEKKQYYLTVRDRFNNTDLPIAGAAMFLFLNKTCFNGLYRVNKSGKFNVPFGRYKKPAFPTEMQIRALSALLFFAKKSDVLAGHYKEVVWDHCRPGDFVYFDSPYHFPDNNGHRYTAAGFTVKDQIELAKTFKALSIAGVKCMLSNSDTELIRELYDGFNFIEVVAHRSISQKASTRGNVTELIITNYPKER